MPLLSGNGRAPEFPVYAEDRWLNAGPLTMESLRGKIVIIDFWEYTCVNCLRTLPYVRAWHERYEKYGVVIVGVHTPEFEFGKNRDNVARAVEELGIPYAVVLDSDYEIWRLYANSYWPRKYIIDREGRIVYDHVGEGGYAETEKTIQRLIKEKDADAPLPPVLELVRAEDAGGRCYPRTPELYAGYGRGRYGNARLEPDVTAEYEEAPTFSEGRLYLNGRWFLGEEAVTSKGDGAGLRLPFSGNEVNAVLSAAPTAPARVYVCKDGRPLAPAEAGEDVTVGDDGSYADVSSARMYRIYKSDAHTSGTLRLDAEVPGLEVFAFTFGSCAIK